MVTPDFPEKLAFSLLCNHDAGKVFHQEILVSYYITKSSFIYSKNKILAEIPEALLINKPALFLWLHTTMIQ